MGSTPSTRDIDQLLAGHFRIAEEAVLDEDLDAEATQAVVEASTDHIRSLARERADHLHTTSE